MIKDIIIHISAGPHAQLPDTDSKTTTPTPETLPGGGIHLPALLSPDSATAQRVLEFFTANIRNPHTRKAYATAVRGAGPRVDRGA